MSENHVREIELVAPNSSSPLQLDFLKCACLLSTTQISACFIKELTKRPYFEILFPAVGTQTASLRQLLQDLPAGNLFEITSYEGAELVTIDARIQSVITSTLTTSSLQRLAHVAASAVLDVLKNQQGSDVPLAQRKEATDHIDILLSWIDQTSLENADPSFYVEFTYWCAQHKQEQGSYESACALLQKSYDIGSRLLSEHSNRLLELQRSLAAIWSELGEYERANVLLEHILATASDLNESPDTFLLQVQDDLANCHLRLGRYDQATELSTHVVVTKQDLFGITDTRTVISSINLAAIHACQGQLRYARQLNRELLQIVEQYEPEGGEHLALLHHNIGSVYLDDTKDVRAETHFRLAYQSRQKILGSNHPKTLDSRSGLAAALVYQNKLEAAENLAPEALRLLESSLGSGHPISLRAREVVAILRVVQGQTSEAQSHFLEILSIRGSRLGMEHPDTLQAAQNLAWCLQQQGNISEAEKACRNAIKRNDILCQQLQAFPWPKQRAKYLAQQ